ncbi:aspartate--tRNA ligase 2, cytoplasmic-like isoform X1 [Triticum dicoccoides]|uniref:aspartate--tRNA ligase 2, cytoplasmic-like isoform X1 n=1 Tax=Triticum dicoccoides TaxID=85692 RepID=UPI0018914517|nr:aspartate--tRNA ligase 2, cytoplasmic-like isoform X1 [Triticum dicoccoides]
MRGCEVDIQVRKLYCINRAGPKLPISMEDARRSAEEFAIAESKGVPLVHVGQDTRLDYRVIDVRTLANQAIFHIQHQVENIVALALDHEVG